MINKSKIIMVRRNALFVLTFTN